MNSRKPPPPNPAGINHLDSPRMPYFTRHRARRGLLPAFAAVFMSALLLTGCVEDRSNLIPTDASQALIAGMDEVQALAAENKCFEAMDENEAVRIQIEQLQEIDPELKRSLLSGVSRIRRLLADPEKCTDVGVMLPEDEPEETEEAPVTPTGSTGPTQTTGEQADPTDEDETSTPPQNNGNGNQNPTNPPATNPPRPTTPTTPTNPSTPPSGSGGIGPG